jgi:hypothetical protein
MAGAPSHELSPLGYEREPAQYRFSESLLDSRAQKRCRHYYSFRDFSDIEDKNVTYNPARLRRATDDDVSLEIPRWSSL